MSNPYFKLRVVDIARETTDAVTLYLEHPEKLPVHYKPGQFLTLIIPFEGNKVRRSYSLCSTPHEKPRLAVTIKRVANGLVSNYLVDHVQTGQEIEVMEPIGNFCLTCDPNQTRHIVLLGAGSGITPLLSILKSVLHEERLSKVTLLYANRNENSVIFKNELERLISEYPDRLQVAYTYSQPLQSPKPSEPVKQSITTRFLASMGLAKATASEKQGGRMTSESILKKLESLGIGSKESTLYFLCGPEGFMDEATIALKKLKVPANKIFTERFVLKKHTAPDTQHNLENQAATAGRHTTQTITILHDGKEYQVSVPPNQTILEAALEQNLDLPYSCQAGLCTACMGKCLSGAVHMDEHDGLSDLEIEEGYVLNCMAHPLTDNVRIEV